MSTFPANYGPCVFRHPVNFCIDYGLFSPPSTNFVDRLAYWARHQGDEAAFLFLPEGEGQQLQITYAQLHQRAVAIAARLQAMNLRGERALLLYPPGLEFIAGLMGCLYAGVVAVPAYPPRRNRNMLRIQAISDDAQARSALTIAEVANRSESFFAEAPHLANLTWLATDEIAPAQPAPADALSTTPGDDSLALLQYTSGSTGKPKGVMLTHSNLMHNVALISHAFGPDRTSLGVSWLPTYHDMGLIGGILNPLFYGRPNVLMPPMAFLSRPVRWLQAISRFGAMISGGPNFAYQLCVDRISPEECEGLDLSCWEVAYNGAEPIRAETLTAFTEKFSPYGFRHAAHYPCYGLAESTLIVTGGDSHQPPVICTCDAAALAGERLAQSNGAKGTRRLVGCGRALPDVELAIVDPETGSPLDEGRVGEILICGPSVAAGYWKKPQATKRTFGARIDQQRCGFLRTGDLGFLKAGQLFVTGRLDDLIVVHGVNRYPEDIEQTVEQADGRLPYGSAAAFGVEMHGHQRLVVVCEVQRKRGQDWSQLIETIRGGVARQHDLPPDAVVLVRFGSLPKTSSGKLQRHACRDAFLDGTLNVVAQWRAWSEAPITDWSSWQDAQGLDGMDGIDAATASVVLDCIRAVARERATGLSLETNILDMGLDSLERMEILASIEETFGGRLPSDVMAEAETCREVVAAVQTYLPAEAERRRPVPLSDEDADFRRMPELRKFRENKLQLQQMGLENPFFQPHEGVAGATTIIDGREVINFASYNYLGMAGDPAVTAAAKAAIDRYGTSVSASRLVSGERPLHRELEAALAELVAVEDAITFVGGHATNESTIGHLFSAGDLVLHDSLAHNSIIQGALLSGARRRAFEHNDWRALDRLLARIRGDYRRVLIAIEGLYGMDGDVPELPRFIEVKRRHRALLLIDEAHSLGTLGATGRGVAEHFGADPRDVDLWMGTLSKALGSCGGYIAGSREVVEYLRYTAPGFVYSVGMSPANAAAALESIRLLRSEGERVAALQETSRLFSQLARGHQLNIGRSQSTAVVPLLLGDAALAVRLSDMLLRRGINVRPLLPPAVEQNASRLRFFITAMHTEDQIRHTIDQLVACLAQLRGTTNSNGSRAAKPKPRPKAAHEDRS